MTFVFAACLLTGIAGYLVFRIITEADAVVLSRVEVPVSDLPVELEGYRILHMTDFHFTGWAKRETRALQLAAKTRPDIIVMTGDFINDSRRLPLVRRFARLAGEIAPLFAVMGNNDHNPGVDTDSLCRTLEDCGAKVLDNEYALAGRGEARLVLAGVDDVRHGYGNLSQAIGQVPNSGLRKPVILLSHAPDVITDIDGQVDLVLSGHTHGGQICLPGGHPLLTHSGLGRRYGSGLFRWGSSYLYISRGVGTTYLRLRLFCRPEVALITLRSANDISPDWSA